MKKIILGKTNLRVTKTSFGALPIQRLSVDGAVEILRDAKKSGISFYDTARAYSDSEKKMGIAFEDCRDEIIIATKTHAKNVEEMKEHIESSLEMLKTDYIDIYQFHNAKDVPMEDSPMYQYMLELKKQGVIRHIGVTAHSYNNAVAAIESGLYETLQYPISCISDEKDAGIAEKCREKNMGVIAMKGMGGGLIDDARVAFSFFQKHENICTIWGIQKKCELDEFIALDKKPPALNKELNDKLERYQKELQGEFCRGCGYCVSACPVDIEINNCARMNLLCGRAVWQEFVTDEWQKKMKLIHDCIGCRQCVEKCPYNLDIPNLLKKNMKKYYEFLEEKGI